MGCSYEEAKVRWYISNLLRTKDLSSKVIEIVMDWAKDKADILGFDETEMENAGKTENPEANLRRQEILLAGLGKHPSRFGTATKSAVEKTLRKGSTHRFGGQLKPVPQPLEALLGQGEAFVAGATGAMYDAAMDAFGAVRGALSETEARRGEAFIASALGRQTFARPPARYSEGSLVKKLEELGIALPRPLRMIVDFRQVQARHRGRLGAAEEK